VPIGNPIRDRRQLGSGSLEAKDSRKPSGVKGTGGFRGASDGLWPHGRTAPLVRLARNSARSTPVPQEDSGAAELTPPRFRNDGGGRRPAELPRLAPSPVVAPVAVPAMLPAWTAEPPTCCRQMMFARRKVCGASRRWPGSSRPTTRRGRTGRTQEPLHPRSDKDDRPTAAYQMAGSSGLHRQDAYAMVNDRAQRISSSRRASRADAGTAVTAILLPTALKTSME